MIKDQGPQAQHTNAGAVQRDQSAAMLSDAIPFRFYSAQSLFLAFMALRHQYSGRDIMKDDLQQADPIYSVCRHIIRDLDKAYRRRKLLMDHIRILNFYGKLGRAPRDWVPKEMSASGLWQDALDILAPQWVKSGYLVDASQSSWDKACYEASKSIGDDGDKSSGRGDQYSYLSSQFKAELDAIRQDGRIDSERMN